MLHVQGLISAMFSYPTLARMFSNNAVQLVFDVVFIATCPANVNCLGALVEGGL